MDEKALQQIYIKVADSDELITAGLIEVVAFSSVAAEAAGLQAGNSAVTWDLSNLDVNSKPVSSRAIRDWLNVVYRLVHGTDHSETPTPGVPPLVTEAATLCDLLELIDAVQTTGGVIAAFESGLINADLFMTVQLAGRADTKIFVDGRGYECSPPFRFHMTNSGSTTSLGANQWVELQQQVAQQTERLLYIAHKLKMPILLSRIMSFITANLLRQRGTSNNPMFSDNILTGLVYSNRVCELLGFAGSDEVKQEWLKGKHQLRLTIGGEGSMLQIIEESGGDFFNPATKVKFNEAFAGHKKGSTADIIITKSSGGSMIKIGTALYQFDTLVA